MRTSIFLKIFFTFLLVTLLPILGLIAYNDWKDKDILIQANKNTIKGDAERVASNIDDLLLSHKTLVCNIRNNHTLIDYLKGKSTFFYFVNRITMHAILTTIAVVILIFFISWMITKSLLSPIYKLKNAAVKISKGEFDHPVKTSRKDELGKLVFLFDDMRKQLQSMNNTLKEIHLETIYTLIKICRGFEKEGLVMHLLRTSEYSTVIAKHMGLDTVFIDTIRYSSLLHDIGLVAVPQYIREKADVLTQAELEVLKSHTIHGEQFLSKKPFFQMARDIALHHHENWDGTGYPDGIKNGAIPLAARIVRIADKIGRAQV